jgi:fructan beta-fructosidase
MHYDFIEHKFAMDRTQSGNISFSKDFPVVTLAPIAGGNEMKIRLLVDRSSIEAFGDDGRFVMTNLIFPSEPYDSIRFYAKGGTYSVTSFTVFNFGQK